MGRRRRRGASARLRPRRVIAAVVVPGLVRRFADGVLPPHHQPGMSRLRAADREELATRPRAPRGQVSGRIEPDRTRCVEKDIMRGPGPDVAELEHRATDGDELPIRCGSRGGGPVMMHVLPTDEPGPPALVDLANALGGDRSRSDRGRSGRIEQLAGGGQNLLVVVKAGLEDVSSKGLSILGRRTPKIDVQIRRSIIVAVEPAGPVQSRLTAWRRGDTPLEMYKRGGHGLDRDR